MEGNRAAVKGVQEVPDIVMTAEGKQVVAGSCEEGRRATNEGKVVEEEREGEGGGIWGEVVGGRGKVMLVGGLKPRA